MRQIFLFVCCFLVVLSAEGQTQADQVHEENHAPESCPHPNTNPQWHYSSPSWVDKTHASVSQQLCKQVNKIDGFFGNVNPTETARGFLRIRTGMEWQQLDQNTTEFQPSIKARVRLPNISRKLHLLIIDDVSEENTIPSTKSSATHHESDTSSTLGDLLGIPGAEPVDYDFDIGSKSDDGPKIFTRARSTFQFWLNERSNLRLSQSLFWLDGLGFGEESRLEYNQALNDTTLFRWITSAEFNEETEGLHINQQLTFFQQLDEKRGLSYSIRLTGDTRPTLTVNEYGVDVLFRRNILKPWFFYEIEPSIYWPVEYDREMALRLVFRFEVQLGDQI